jgi:hypothetical protein
MKSRFKTTSGLARRIAWVGLLLVSVGLPAVAQEYSPALPQQQALGDLCANGIISIRALRFLVVFSLAAIAIFFIQIDLRLKRAGWSLKRALSEPKRLTFVGDKSQQSDLINLSNSLIINEFFIIYINLIQYLLIHLQNIIILIFILLIFLDNIILKIKNFLLKNFTMNLILLSISLKMNMVLK